MESTQCLRNACDPTTCMDLSEGAITRTLGKVRTRMTPSLVKLYTADYDPSADAEAPAAVMQLFESLQEASLQLGRLLAVAKAYSPVKKSDGPPASAEDLLAAVDTFNAGSTAERKIPRCFMEAIVERHADDLWAAEQYTDMLNVLVARDNTNHKRAILLCHPIL